MNAAGRLAAFCVVMVVAFGAAYATAAAVGPAPAAQGNASSTAKPLASNEPPAPGAMPVGDPAGLSLARDGYQLSPVRAPGTVDARGILSFSILDSSGEPLRDYDTVHDKQLHLIVVRSDGSHYAHVHPILDRRSGTWSIPWTWNAAGTYRVFADFAPTDGRQLTLTRTVEVAGAFAPSQAPGPRTVDRVDGYTVELQGTMTAGTSAQLTARITRDGQPVRALQPYLGAFGHLVALREGDLAYLHVHPEGAEPSRGTTVDQRCRSRPPHPPPAVTCSISTSKYRTRCAPRRSSSMPPAAASALPHRHQMRITAPATAGTDRDTDHPEKEH